ncbi:prenyltransferase [Haladaptatus sp. GCM10025707]|uniref:prenyltransferase n=1 Tax=Haladaptatus sp. GCM10025707 TaxID=3252658 RepID=UPI00360DC464
MDRAPSTIAWAVLAMSRPSHLLLVAWVYALGVAIAYASGAAYDPRTLVAGLAALLPAAASIHYVNEYADHETDALTTRTPFSGGSGALPRTGLTPKLALSLALGTLLVGVVVTGYLYTEEFLSRPAVGLLALGALLGWAYSLPPVALAWRGLGELDTAVVGGLVLPQYGVAVAAGGLSRTALLATVPFSILVFVNLLAVMWPDREADAEVGKRTLATRLSPRWLRRLYLGGVLATFVALAAFTGGVLPRPVALASYAIVPLLAWGQHVHENGKSTPDGARDGGPRRRPGPRLVPRRGLLPHLLRLF